MDTIFINELEAQCRVGDTPEERAFPQIILISIQLHLNLEPAGQSNDLSQTVDYAQVINQAREFVSKKEFVLVEAVAEGLAHLLLKNHSKIDEIKIRIGKKVFPGVGLVGVSITRQR